MFDNASSKFLAAIVSRLSTRVCLWHDYVCRAGDNSDEMFFVRYQVSLASVCTTRYCNMHCMLCITSRGALEVMVGDGDNESVVSMLDEGSYFGIRFMYYW